jgi:hypothetical protein
MLFVIGVMGVAFALEGQLFSESLHAISNTSAAEAQQAQVREMTSWLQRDVWGASEIQTPDSKTIVLIQPSGAVARWRLGEGSVERSLEDRGRTSRKWAIAVPLTAESQGRGTLVLRSASPHFDARMTRRFSSQILLAGEFK